MTLNELNKFFDLLNELEGINEVINNLRATAQTGAHILTGTPNSTDLKDKVGDLASEIADMENCKADIEKEIEHHKEAVEAFVKTIGDYFTRTIFRLRFERGLAWKEVASVMGKGYSEDCVRSTCYRYMRKQRKANNMDRHSA